MSGDGDMTDSCGRTIDSWTTRHQVLPVVDLTKLMLNIAKQVEGYIAEIHRNRPELNPTEGGTQKGI